MVHFRISSLDSASSYSRDKDSKIVTVEILGIGMIKTNGCICVLTYWIGCHKSP
jgi:hypothetical protein